MGTIEKSVTINADASKVLAALTESSQLEKWFPTKAVSEPQVGGKYHLTFIRPGEDTHVVDGQFTAVGPQKVSTSWPMEGLGDTEVDWIISESGSGTQVDLVHNGIGDEGPWEQVRAMMDPGWGMFVSNLKNYLEGGDDLRGG
jgi:uncharacterized protein YndB with AHSA1/START domain